MNKPQWLHASLPASVLILVFASCKKVEQKETLVPDNPNVSPVLIIEPYARAIVHRHVFEEIQLAAYDFGAKELPPTNFYKLAIHQFEANGWKRLKHLVIWGGLDDDNVPGWQLVYPEDGQLFSLLWTESWVKDREVLTLSLVAEYDRGRVVGDKFRTTIYIRSGEQKRQELEVYESVYGTQDYDPNWEATPDNFRDTTPTIE
jgi:hypothetical protein